MDFDLLNNQINFFKSNGNSSNFQSIPDIKNDNKDIYALISRKKYLSHDKIKIFLKKNQNKSSLLYKNIVDFNKSLKINNNMTCDKNNPNEFLNGKFLIKTQRCLSSRNTQNTQNMNIINQKLKLFYNAHNQLSRKITDVNFLTKSDTENNINDKTYFSTKRNNILCDFNIIKNNNLTNTNYNKYQTKETCKLDLSDQNKNKFSILNIVNYKTKNDNKKMKLDEMISRYKIKSKRYNTRVMSINKKQLNGLFQQNDFIRRRNKSKTIVNNKLVSDLQILNKINSRNYNTILDEITPSIIDNQRKKSFSKILKTKLYNEMRMSKIQDLKLKIIKKLEKCDIYKFTRTEKQKKRIKYLNLDLKESKVKNNIIKHFNNKLFFKYGKIRLKLESKISNNIKIIYKKIEDENKEQQIKYKEFFIKKGLNVFKNINNFSFSGKEINLFFYKIITNNICLNTWKLQIFLNDNSYQLISNYCYTLDYNNVYQKNLRSFSSILKNSSIDDFSYNNKFNFFQKNNKTYFPKFKDVRDFSVFYALKYQLLDNFLNIFSNNKTINVNQLQNKKKVQNKTNEQKTKKIIKNNIKKKNNSTITDKTETFNFTKKCIERVLEANKIKDPEILELLKTTKILEKSGKMPTFPKLNFPRRLMNLCSDGNITERKNIIFNGNIFDEFGKKTSRAHYRNDLNANLEEVNLLKNKKYNQFLINHITNKDINELLYKIEKYYQFIDLNYKNEEGNTLLHLCVINQISTNLMDFLIHKGININCQNNNLDTPLHIACRNRYYPYINMLIKYGANEDILNSEQLTCWEC